MFRRTYGESCSSNPKTERKEKLTFTCGYFPAPARIVIFSGAGDAADRARSSGGDPMTGSAREGAVCSDEQRRAGAVDPEKIGVSGIGSGAADHCRREIEKKF